MALTPATPTHSRDSGAALPLVIALGMVIIIVATSAIAFANGGGLKSRHDADWDAALAAAYAGVEEYRSRLTAISDYQLCINDNSPFTPEPPSEVDGCGTNPALSVEPAGDWARLDDRSAFRYEIDNSGYASTGELRIRATGRVGTVTRSVIAELREEDLTRYAALVMFATPTASSSNNWGSSNWGTPDWGDPTAPTSDQFARKCDRAAWAGRDSEACPQTVWGAPGTLLGNAVWQGPVHSNDSIVGCDVTFEDSFGSSDPHTRADTSRGCGDDQRPVVYKKVIDIPTTLGVLRENTQPVPINGAVGCLYTGPTSVKFHSNGSMTVRSPQTKYTNVRLDLRDIRNPAECGTPGTAPGALGSPGGATISVLDGSILYVQDITDATKDPNSHDTWTVQAGCFTSNGVGFPIAGESHPVAINNNQYRTAACPYGARSGDLFVEGEFTGSMSLAAEGSAYLTGNLTNVEPMSDLLGIMAQRDIVVWNPITWERPIGCEVSGACGSPIPLVGGDREISASLLSTNGGIVVQNAGAGGNQGALRIHGSVASRYAGITHITGPGGYTGGYQDVVVTYNERLRSAAPPRFIRPNSAVHTLAELIEVKPAFSPDGTPQ
ncbi:hypothetical protein SAMN06295974_1905 [Plantibacter flavus]|uniref:Uncharacterized protein n=1 Tax=Plantibacter flavus TaxID=150123 RepID=A0A3N2BXK9_9MICO|nr:hypothetical protein [Plantibacter flavus]ROR80011.1 hypothetical protein EDD42_0042 [Plantibacter flavus]SMG28534.1 hypothetical protein SAMN06295974_1905 [Plantibacter flavus]